MSPRPPPVCARSWLRSRPVRCTRVTSSSCATRIGSACWCEVDDGNKEVSMRKLVLQMNYSLDGFVSAREDKSDGTGWASRYSGDPVLAKYFVQYVSGVGAHLMGSATYRVMAAYWPTSTNPYAPPMNQIPKIVFS